MSIIDDSANLENEAIEAMRALVEDYGYTREDLENLVRLVLNE